MNKAFFFDRDGVLNEIVERDGGHYSPQDFSQFKIVEEAIKVPEPLSELPQHVPAL